MTGGNSTTTQNSQSQSRHSSPLHAGNCQDPGQIQHERKKSKEIIHSGHFMVSDFEAEGRDDDDELAIPVPEDVEDPAVLVGTGAVGGINCAGDLAGNNPASCSVVTPMRSKKSDTSLSGLVVDSASRIISTTIYCVSPEEISMQVEDTFGPAVTIDQSLTKLFQCMTLAYSSKLTSPRWKNFKGLRLQWKDKIRLNNLIWRCWHMQFIEKRNTAVCQFASPLEVDQHNKPEAVVLEGKYWKRRLATVTAEYKKWRIFFKNQLMGRTSKDLNDISMSGELDQLDWFARSNGIFSSGTGPLALDDDLFMDFSDTLFSSLSSNQPFPFPNPREIAKGVSLADFIQPGLIQLQPNLDDFMDTLEPLHDLLSGRLPPVEEEIVAVEDTMAIRESHRRHHDYHNSSSPYCVSRTPQTLLNYMPMDQSSSYMFAHHQSNQQQMQLETNNVFGYSSAAPSSSQNSSYGSQQQQQSSSFMPAAGSSNAFELAAPFQRQNSAGSEHDFAVPAAQFQGKQRSRSRSGSATTTSTTSATMSGGALSASQPSISSSRGSSRGKTSSSSPARLLNSSSSQDATSLRRNRSRDLPSPPAITPRPILPDNGTLLAQLLTSSATAPTTLLLTAESTNSRLIFPVSDATATAAKLEKPATFTADFVADQSSKREMQPIKVEESPTRSKSSETGERSKYQEHRRVCHINAEQKRRCNIKNGFDTLQSLLPGGNAQGSSGSCGSASGHGKASDVSKAAMLHRGAEYIRQLRQEKQQQKDEMEQLKLNIETLNTAISGCQALLPANGAPVSRQRSNRMREMFDEWVRVRTLQNWKFWIFSILIQPLLDSYCTALSASTYEDLWQNVLNWVDQYCSLIALRPVVFNSLRNLSKTTDILTNPSRLPAEATQAVSNPDRT